MRAKKKVQRNLVRDFRRYKDQIAGILGDYSGTVEVPNRSGYVFVRLANQEVKEAFNKKVPNLVDLPVWVGYADDPREPHILQVLDTRTGVERQKGENPISQFLPLHHQTHEWFNPEGGQDVVFSDKRQFMPFRPTPAGGMLLHVYRNVGWLNGQYTYFSGSSIDLSPYVPATGAYFGLIYEDINATLAFSSGTGDFLKDGFSLTLADIPNPLPGTYPIAAVRMWGGQTGIVEARDRTDLVDLRFPFTYGFNQLYDAPWSYTGSGGLFVAVKGDETGLEFVTGSGGGGASTFLGLTDTPSSYSGQSLKYPRVNAGETALEFVEPATAFVFPFYDDGSFLVTGTLADLGHNLDGFSTGSSAFIDVTVPYVIDEKSAPGEIGDFHLITGTSANIVDDSNYNMTPALTKMGNGNLFVAYRRGTSHAADKGDIVMKTSSDEGNTWSSGTVIYSDPTYDVRDPGILKASDDRLILSFYKYNHTGSSYVLDGAYVTYSDDDGTTWSSPYQINSFFTSFCTSGSSPPIELRDGTLLQALRGQNSGDSFESTSVIKSTDNGETWHSEILIADGEDDSRHYNEGNLVLLHDNNIICLMRSDTPNAANGNHFRSFSYDDGKTWSVPTSKYSATGNPHFIQTKSGLLIVIYRGTSIDKPKYRVSRNNGYSWTVEYPLDESTMSGMLYASPFEYEEGIVGVAWGKEISASNADILFKRFYLSESSGKFISNVPDGISPLEVQSQTLVNNLNADLLDGFHASDLGATGSVSSLIDWTPTVTQSGGVTVTVSYAKYVTLGSSLYYICAQLSVTGSGSAGNDIVIGNLPAAPAANGVFGTGWVYNADANVFYQGAAIYIGGNSGFSIRAHLEQDDIGVDPSFALANGDIIHIVATYPV